MHDPCRLVRQVKEFDGYSPDKLLHRSEKTSAHLLARSITASDIVNTPVRIVGSGTGQ
jgi:hypothetical protein